MYADDTALYLGGPTVHNLIFYNNQDLQCLSEWREDNSLVLKQKLSVYYLHLKGIKSDCILNFNLLGKSISCETTFNT